MSIDRGPLDLPAARGEPGPRTRRTMREIENEGRARLGLPPIIEQTRVETEHYVETWIRTGPTLAEVNSLEAGMLLDLRQKWADRPGEEH